jgi:hypothetical protein
MSSESIINTDANILKVVFSNWVHKKSKLGLFDPLKVFQGTRITRKYLVLTRRELFCFEEMPKEMRLKSEFDKSTYIELSEIRSVAEQEEDSFLICLKGILNNMSFKCSNTEERDIWINYLRETISSIPNNSFELSRLSLDNENNSQHSTSVLEGFKNVLFNSSMNIKHFISSRFDSSYDDSDYSPNQGKSDEAFYSSGDLGNIENSAKEKIVFPTFSSDQISKIDTIDKAISSFDMKETIDLISIVYKKLEYCTRSSQVKLSKQVSISTLHICSVTYYMLSNCTLARASFVYLVAV